MQILPGFIQNTALLLTIGLILDLRTRHAAFAERGGRVGFGLLLGAAGIVTMLFPVRLEPGLILDSRGLLLAISGLFFGLVPTAVAMAVSAAYRAFAIGGPSTLTGVSFILGSGALGLGWRHWHRGRKDRPKTRPHWLEFPVLGLAVAAFQLWLVWRLLPVADRHVFWTLAPTLLAVSAAATLLMGILLRDRFRHLQVVAQLAEREGSLRALVENQTLQTAALNAAVDAIAITDADGRLLWVNPSFTALTQFSADEALGQSPRALLHSGHHGEEFYAKMWETLLAGHVWRGELVNRKKDGTEYTEEQTITPVKDAEGRVTHFIAIKRDVTDSRLLQQRLHQTQRMEGIGRLAGGVAHDFNNLLTVINGTVELMLARARGDAVMTQDLETVRAAALRGAKLTRQLLAFSRQQVLQPTVVDLNGIVTEMHALLSRLIGEHIAMRLDLQADLAHIRADAGQIGQVLMNLVVNARDAMPDGGTIAVRSATMTLAQPQHLPAFSMPPGHYVTLTVTDTGTGMDAATQERIFEPFFTTKAPGKGTGLGLPTAYGIVKQSGGFIWVDSALGRGTTFHLAFPAVDDVITERSSGPTPRVDLADDTTPAAATILLVEDEEAIRHVASRVLSTRGFTVLAAGSGEEALALAAEHPIDLLLTDMVMPGIGGPELAQRLRALRPTVKVLFTSGYSRDAIAHEFGLEDAGFIAKPYGLAQLVSAVRERLA